METSEAKQVYQIEGVVHFNREADPSKQVCICCPAGGGHIFGRGVNWDQWETGLPLHFGNGPNELVHSKICGKNANEGRRVRVTVEVLDD